MSQWNPSKEEARGRRRREGSGEHARIKILNIDMMDRWQEQEGTQKDM